MVHSLPDYVRQELANKYSLETIRKDLIGKGFIEEDVDRAIYTVTKNIKYEKNLLTRKLNRIFGAKETFDHFGYGFGNQQMVNILFGLTGASLLVIGLINGLKSLVSTVVSSVLKEYTKVHDMSKKFISVLGIVFGLSFMFIAMAVRMESVWLFVVALLIGSLGVVGHGDIYKSFLARTLGNEKRGLFLRRIPYFGMLLTLATLLLAGILLDLFPVDSVFTISLFGQETPLVGYVMVFMLASIMFILSGYVLSFVDEMGVRQQTPFRTFWKNHLANVHDHLKVFGKSKVIFLLFFATTVTGVAQVLGASYYGIFIYQRFSETGLGGFMNVAVIFGLAILVSFIGPAITKWVSDHVGEAPMLVFGTLLIALLNLVLAFNPNLLAIGAGVALATIGAAIIGVAQGLMALKIMREEERKHYFSALGRVIIIPFAVLVPVGAYVAQQYGLQTLFMGLGAVLTIIVAPLYFIIVLMSNKAELVA